MSHTTDASVHDLLDEYNTEKYYIIYKGFMSNHVSHGIIALHKLGAPVHRIVQFAEHYSKKLESPDQFQNETLPPGNEAGLSEATWEQLRGTRKSYFPILHHYQDALKNQHGGSLERFIAAEWPKLYRGMFCSVFHGLIQLGYGYEARNAGIVCEGMAKLHHCYLPLNTAPPGKVALETHGKGERDILDVLGDIAMDSGLATYMTERSETEEWANLGLGQFQPMAGVLFTDRANQLLDYANQIQFPLTVDVSKLNKDGITKMATWLVDCALVVYIMAARRNNFVLIHGVTSSWSLARVLPLLDDYACALKSVRVFLCALLATYVVMGCPALDKKVLDETPVLSWQEIKTKALSEERDEHIYKMVQVCWDMQLGSDDDKMKGLYRLAADMCVRYPLTMM